MDGTVLDLTANEEVKQPDQREWADKLMDDYPVIKGEYVHPHDQIKKENAILHNQTIIGRQ